MKKTDTSVIFIVACVVLIVLMSFGLGFVIRDRVGGINASGMGALTEMENTIKKYFYFFDESESEDAIVDSALRGMVKGLDDPYANYYTADEYNAMLAEDAGDYVGIGISVGTPDDVGSLIIDVYVGSPAAQAGVCKGDIILSINGTTAAGLSMDDFMNLFIMKDGAENVLVLRRGAEEVTLSVICGDVHVNRVAYELLDDGIGYIHISEFNGSVVTDFWNAAKDLRDNSGVHKMILDLRDNPGGGLTEVLGVCNYLVPKGQVLVTIKSKTESAEVYRSEGKERLDMDLVVLVNGGSASASELLTGALKDYKLATIVGTQTYGKGIVQSYFRLNSNGGWIKLTTDAYYTPSDVCIHGVGISPDIVVNLPEELKNMPIELLEHEKDTQLQAAIDVLNEETTTQNAA